MNGYCEHCGNKVTFSGGCSNAHCTNLRLGFQGQKLPSTLNGWPLQYESRIEAKLDAILMKLGALEQSAKESTR